MIDQSDDLLGQFDFGVEETLAGFRLQRLELYNWGTFHNRVWSLQANGNNTLVTGDIGSGKSTLVDAVTTLLVPAQRVAYNKAAGAGSKERTLRSYVQGYYKSERSEVGGSSKPVALRDHNSYSVILATFHNAGYDQSVTLAQLFWSKDTQGQPARFFVVARRPMTVADDFSGFGKEINTLKRRLRNDPHIDLFESFPPYSARFRRLFGIDNEQALELFHQTVSMKSVGNLTNFVRQHMLEPFDVQPRIDALIHHFDDLNRAHEAILRAKRQIERLTPLISDCDEQQQLSALTTQWRHNREAIIPFFANLKRQLLERRMERLQQEQQRIAVRLEQQQQQLSEQLGERDQIKQAIARNGGDRLERLRSDIEEKTRDKERRQQRAERYNRLAEALQLPKAHNSDQFIDNRHQLKLQRQQCDGAEEQQQNWMTEQGVELRTLKQNYEAYNIELESLRRRSSNISDQQIQIRQLLCSTLQIDPEEMPFAGELIQVREEAHDWEGVAERLLHNFALSLLVPDALYAVVSDWVEQTHLRGRLVYYRIRQPQRSEQHTLHPDSLIRKLSIKPDSLFYGWIEQELGRRFDYACCEQLEQFRREQRAVTRNGQIKAGGVRHEKDDRHRINDRSRYLLGWSNQAKIDVLEQQAAQLEQQMQRTSVQLSESQQQLKQLRQQQEQLVKIGEYRDFGEIEWQQLSLEISQLGDEFEQLQSASDLLLVLNQQLGELEQRLQQSESQLDKLKQERTTCELKLQQSSEQIEQSQLLVNQLEPEFRVQQFEQLEILRSEALGEHTLSVESCENRAHELREWLQRQINGKNQRINTLSQRIIAVMQQYRNDYPQETEELDVGIEAAEGYRTQLQELERDGLPVFEARFKTLLNENTIREVANFQSQLTREENTIKERIERINHSLNQIDYNPGRYILLERQRNGDPEINAFKQDLRSCLEGGLTGSEEEQYSEAKFVQVKRIIERFRGREGSGELDRRWTQKVSDVRNSFLFSASERWREDDREHEHYTDSGGKSGGQKEKLAYTVLAASLAYQFGLEWGATRSRSFRFVVIDEAFGRGSDESARFGLRLFKQLNLQLLIVTPLQKIHIIEPYVASVGFVHNDEGRESKLRNLTIDEYRSEKAARTTST
ncbi:MAG: ATP-dependent exonuclease SbcCD, C subunit-like protein [Gammaproteobacteria bacterium]|nr:ATP-dependent exonuclease SbcCD, C subunit-like protein [Gammaproteobacteria bacterium]